MKTDKTKLDGTEWSVVIAEYVLFLSLFQSVSFIQSPQHHLLRPPPLPPPHCLPSSLQSWLLIVKINNKPSSYKVELIRRSNDNKSLLHSFTINLL